MSMRMVMIAKKAGMKTMIEIKRKSEIIYHIHETDDGFGIYKYNGQKMIGLMGIVSDRKKAMKIAQKLSRGITRIGWD